MAPHAVATLSISIKSTGVSLKKKFGFYLKKITIYWWLKSNGVTE